MSTRPRLSEWEQTWAFVAGGGLALIILAFGLSAMRGTDDNSGALNFMLIIGVVLAVGGTAGWLIQYRPWLTFDDQATPLYTGHDAHGHDAAHTEGHTTDLQTADMSSEPPLIVHPVNAEPIDVHPAQPSVIMPPVMMDPMSAFPSAPPAAVTPPPVTLPPGTPNATTAQPKTVSGHDDFESLVGINPKIAAALTASGIFTFAEMIRRTPEELEHIVRESGVRMVGSNANTWVEQARFAAAGDTEALKQYQDALQHSDESHE